MNHQRYAGIAVTFVVHFGLITGVAAFTDWSPDKDKQEDKKFLAIEATLARQSDLESNQPQKPKASKPKASKPRPSDPRPTPNPDTAPQTPRPDATPKPDQAEAPKTEDFSDDFERYLRERQASADDESESADPNAEEGAEDAKPTGQFDGSKHGFAEVSRGDPYMQNLAAQVYQGWELTTLEKGVGAAVGCVRLAADGSVVAVELWQPTGNTNIDLSVKNALAAVQKQRKPGESPVPPHLMDATTQWTCFKFSVDGP